MYKCACVRCILKYTYLSRHEDGVDPGQSSPPLGARAKTTEEVIAEIENEEYVPPPPSKGKKKYVKFSEVEGRTPVECKRIELMVREHKVKYIQIQLYLSLIVPIQPMLISNERRFKWYLLQR